VKCSCLTWVGHVHVHPSWMILKPCYSLGVGLGPLISAQLAGLKEGNCGFLCGIIHIFFLKQSFKILKLHANLIFLTCYSQILEAWKCLFALSSFILLVKVKTYHGVKFSASNVFLVYFLQKFILGGRLIFGPDARSLIVTLLLIIVPIIIFCVFVARHLRHEFSPDNVGYVILVMAIIFTIYVSLLNPLALDKIVFVIWIL